MVTFVTFGVAVFQILPGVVDTIFVVVVDGKLGSNFGVPTMAKTHSHWPG
jgi:hypothetical protein